MEKTILFLLKKRTRRGEIYLRKNTCRLSSPHPNLPSASSTRPTNFHLQKSQLTSFKKSNSMSFSLSFASISLHSPRGPQNPSIPNIKSPPRPKNPSTQLVSPFRLPLPPIKIRSSHSLSALSKPSGKSTLPSDANPHLVVPFLRSLSQNVAVLALVSALSIATFGCRPALAEKSTKTVPLEEKMRTQKENDEDDEGKYLKMLERNPRDVEALKMVLYGKMRKGKMDEAVGYVERLVDVEPKDVEWRLLRALSYELTGDLGKAKKLFKDILKERPLLVRALHGLALAMHKNHEDPAVFGMLNKALELAIREQRVTEERNIKLLIAQMHVVMGDLQGGLQKFKKLASENPRDFRPFLCQGIIYSLLNNKEEADKQFGIYQALIPEEFPQRSFLDDAILSAKTKSREDLQKEFDMEFSSK